MNATTPPLNGLKYLGVAAAGAADGDALTRRHPMRGHRCWYLNLGVPEFLPSSFACKWQLAWADNRW